MSYLTVEVDIDHGRIIPREPQTLPDTGTGLLTILPSAKDHDALLNTPRPFGLAKGQFVIPHDFNAPLPEEVLRDFEGA